MHQSTRPIFSKPFRQRFTKTLAILLSVLLSTDTAVFAAGGFGGLGGAFATPKPAPTSAPHDDKARREQIASRLDALGEIAQRIANETPRDHDDPNAVLAATGKDPAAILKWVRSNTRLIAYAGMLRGAFGVLMDRAGNSLDRSLLLADLLHRAGHDVRLARAHLDSQTAAALRARMEALAPNGAQPAALDRAELLKRIGSDPRLDPQFVQRIADQTIADNQRFEIGIKELQGKAFPAVMQALGNDPRRDQKLAADTEAVLSDHFWVQRHIPGGWEDLDPDADVVHKLTPEAILAAEQVPEKLKHRVTLRVILETWSAGKLSETKLLEQSWTPSELMGKPITLSHSLLPRTPVTQIAQQPNPQHSYVDELTRAWVIQPTLHVGDHAVTDKLYTLRGEVRPAGAATLEALGVGGTLSTQPLQGVLGAFGGSAPAGSGPPDEATAPVKVTAEWLEFQIDGPGHASEQHRRAIFDLLGPAGRKQSPQKQPTIDLAAKRLRAYSLSGATDVLIFGATPDPSWIQRIGGEQVAPVIKHLALAERSATNSIADINRYSNAGRLQPALWGWAMNRFAASSTGAAPIAPNVALFWQTAAADPSGLPKPALAFDIVANEVEAAATFSKRVAQGVADTIVEQAVLGETDSTSNAASLYAADLARGRHWAVLAPGEKGIERLGLNADARTRIEQELARGSIVVARDLSGNSSAAERAAWWRIDPRTGTTLGVGENGKGVALVGEAAMEHFVEDLAVCEFLAIASVMIGHVSGESIAMFAACIALGFGGTLAHGMWLGSACGALDFVLRAFEGIQYASSGHGEGHGGE